MTNTFIFVVLQLDNDRFIEAFSTLGAAKSWCLAKMNKYFFPSIIDNVGEDGGPIFCTASANENMQELVDLDFKIVKIKLL